MSEILGIMRAYPGLLSAFGIVGFIFYISSFGLVVLGRQFSSKRYEPVSLMLAHAEQSELGLEIQRDTVTQSFRLAA